MSSDIRISLGYRDPLAAISFLTSLGFEKGVTHDGDDGVIYHAEVSWPGGGVISVHSAEPDGKSVADLADRAASDGGYPALTVHVDVLDPDSLYETAVQAGARVVRELQDSPHGVGTRGFIVADPEGLYWSFGTPLPELARDSDRHWSPRVETL
jgi:uncharacterized glyoxalase superfamily protein PhnB